MMRQFRSASGRTWIAQIARSDNPTVEGDILRFWSNGLTCELTDWPSDWERMSEPMLRAILDKALIQWVASPRGARLVGTESQSSRMGENQDRV